MQISSYMFRFNLGSLEGLTRVAILVVCDTTKTTYEFCFVWFEARCSIQLSYGRVTPL